MSDLETATLAHQVGVAMGTDPHLSRRLAATAGPAERPDYGSLESRLRGPSGLIATSGGLTAQGTTRPRRIA
jgi:hypothetical protein